MVRLNPVLVKRSKFLINILFGFLGTTSRLPLIPPIPWEPIVSSPLSLSYSPSTRSSHIHPPSSFPRLLLESSVHPTSHPSANFPNLPRNLFPAWLCSNKMVDCTSMVHRVVSCHWALEENRSHYLKALCISLSLKV